MTLIIVVSFLPSPVVGGVSSNSSINRAGWRSRRDRRLTAPINGAVRRQPRRDRAPRGALPRRDGPKATGAQVAWWPATVDRRPGGWQQVSHLSVWFHYKYLAPERKIGEGAIFFVTLIISVITLIHAYTRLYTLIISVITIVTNGAFTPKTILFI